MASRDQSAVVPDEAVKWLARRFFDTDAPTEWQMRRTALVLHECPYPPTSGGVFPADGQVAVVLTREEAAGLLGEFRPGGGTTPGHVLDSVEAKLSAALEGAA